MLEYSAEHRKVSYFQSNNTEETIFLLFASSKQNDRCCTVFLLTMICTWPCSVFCGVKFERVTAPRCRRSPGAAARPEHEIRLPCPPPRTRGYPLPCLCRRSPAVPMQNTNFSCSLRNSGYKSELRRHAKRVCSCCALGNFCIQVQTFGGQSRVSSREQCTIHSIVR